MIQNQTNNTHDKIVFFDGVCNLCNSSVDYLIDKDRKKLLRYGSLQGKTAAELIPEHTEDLDSFVYLRTNEHSSVLYKRSGAAIRVLSDLGGWRKILLALLVIPPFIRNGVYNWVAKNRYKWFGKKETCRLPEPHERELFLD